MKKNHKHRKYNRSENIITSECVDSYNKNNTENDEDKVNILALNVDDVPVVDKHVMNGTLKTFRFNLKEKIYYDFKSVKIRNIFKTINKPIKVKKHNRIKEDKPLVLKMPPKLRLNMDRIFSRRSVV